MMDDELLSAYVDGELSPEELAAVEARLRDDPRARQLVAELRGVSETLRSLPKHKLGADLREPVLRQAVVDRQTAPPDSGSARRWAWAALALAAALLLTVYLPEAGQERQRVAQADAKQLDAEQPAPQLRAPAEEPAEVASLVADEVAAPAASSELLEGSVAFEAEAEQPAIAKDNFAVGGGGGEYRDLAVMSRRVQPANETSAEAFEVHLTPGDSQIGPAHFDQLLASHGIALRDRANANSIRAGGAADSVANGRSEASSEDKPTAVEAELVLVEAPLEEIQKIMAACSGDESPWKSLRSVGQKSSSSSLALQTAEKLRAASPVETGVSVALDGLHLGDEPAELDIAQTEEQNQPFLPQQTAAAVRGWATHLGRGRAAAQPAPQSAGKRELADLGDLVQPERRDASSGPSATVRVLFILHPAAE